MPGAQRPEHVGAVAPLTLLNVPPRQIVQSFNLVAPSFFPHRPSGHRSHSDALASPVEPLYVPFGHSTHLASTVVLADSAVACFPAAQEDNLQLTLPGSSWYSFPIMQSAQPLDSLPCPSRRPRLPAGQAEHKPTFTRPALVEKRPIGHALH